MKKNGIKHDDKQNYRCKGCKLTLLMLA
ncbi:transposase-like zinc-binding domain-containing protein [Acinetobacter sp. TY1]